MLNNTPDVTAASGGAGFMRVHSPWISLSAVGMNHFLAKTHVPAAGTPDARLAAFRPTPAMTTQPAAEAAVLPAAINTRKQYVHKTRKSVGGYGAMGPYPEREPA